MEEAAARFCVACGRPLHEESNVLRQRVIEVMNLGRVTIQDMIGHGSLGSVHRGWLEYSTLGDARKPAHPVAVKLLTVGSRPHPARVLQLIAELDALSRLAHPNIAAPLGVYDDGREIALISELVPGETLTNLIARFALSRAQGEPCLRLGYVLQYFCALLGALAAAHAIGILHRDVRTKNAMVRLDGTLKLTDFGTALLVPPDTLDRFQAQRGALAYLAPETILGAPLDPRSDLYSAAIVLYEMLTGTTPFFPYAGDERELRRAQLEEAPLALSAQLRSVPLELDAVLARALAKDPAHRFASALDFGEALFRALREGESPAWAAQREFASVARTLSARIPQVGAGRSS